MRSDPRPARQKLWLYQGALSSTFALAQLAGVAYDTMKYRLKTRTPDEAVAMGVADPGRAWRDKAGAFVAAQPKKPAAPRAKKQMTALKLAADAREIERDVVPIIAKTPPPRFHVEPDQVPLLFRGLRPGQYLDSGSAIERALKERSMSP